MRNNDVVKKSNGGCQTTNSPRDRTSLQFRRGERAKHVAPTHVTTNPCHVISLQSFVVRRTQIIPCGAALVHLVSEHVLALTHDFIVIQCRQCEDHWTWPKRHLMDRDRSHQI